MEPLAIAILAFIGTKAAETTVEKFTEAALEKAKQLRQKIIDKLSSDPRAELALLAAQEGSEADVEVVSNYLQEAMAADSQFAQEIKALAERVEECRIKQDGSRNLNTHDHSKGYQTHDHSTVYETNVNNATTSFVGGNHHHYGH
ncbi:MAG: hypothetical protein F6K26_36360 [Moorea sp. SIO2I5]|nr:hypothetical protein [Moorena sp. SIO2I5]